MGDRHLVTVPQGVVEDRLPWDGEGQRGGGGGATAIQPTVMGPLEQGEGGEGAAVYYTAADEYDVASSPMQTVILHSLPADPLREGPRAAFGS